MEKWLKIKFKTEVVESDQKDFKLPLILISVKPKINAESKLKLSTSGKNEISIWLPPTVHKHISQ